MTLRSLSRRVLAVASCALIGVLGGVSSTSGPAAATAQAAAVEGSCAWDADTQEWLVSWTITNEAPAGATSYRLASVEATPGGSAVEEIEATQEGEFPFDAGERLVGLQRLPEGTTAASLTVRAEWDNLQQQEQTGEVEIPTDCGPPELVSQWNLECDALTITIHNPAAEAVTLTFAPTTGTAVPVEVVGGGDATVEYPPSEGLAVDVLLEDRSIVDPSDPIRVTPEQLASLACDEQDEGGGGGGLPATGTSTLIVAGGALVLLALGTGLYLLARRRRIRFTA